MASYVEEEEEEEESLEHTLLVVREVSVYKIPQRTFSRGGTRSGPGGSGSCRAKPGCEIRLEEPNSGELLAACFVEPGQRENFVETVLDSSRYLVLKKEVETIRINVKHKQSSAVARKTKALGIAPPPGKFRSSLPPPPYDPAVAWMSAANNKCGGGGGGGGVVSSKDAMSNFSQLERNLPVTSGTTEATSSGWAAF